MHSIAREKYDVCGGGESENASGPQSGGSARRGGAAACGRWARRRADQAYRCRQQRPALRPTDGGGEASRADGRPTDRPPEAGAN